MCTVINVLNLLRTWISRYLWCDQWQCMLNGACFCMMRRIDIWKENLGWKHLSTMTGFYKHNNYLYNSALDWWSKQQAVSCTNYTFKFLFFYEIVWFWYIIISRLNDSISLFFIAYAFNKYRIFDHAQTNLHICLEIIETDQLQLVQMLFM